MPEQMSGPGKAGVVNPYAMVEVLLGRKVDWPNVADRKAFIQAVLNFPYEKLFDPQYGSPLYPGRRFDVKKKVFVADPGNTELINGTNRLLHLNKHLLAAGAAGNTNQQWVDPGTTFFSNSPDFAAPVQGSIPDCHFIAAIGSLAWSNPYDIIQAVRPVSPADALVTGGSVDRIFFYAGTGSASAPIEVTELLPLIEPGNLYQYAQSAHPGELWPAVYEKAWVKWITNDPGDQPDYSKVGGGDPVNDLVSLTGKNYNSYATNGQTGDQIWNAVRSNCRGSWTFNPMAATTYGSSAAAPTPIDYDTSGIVADHCYSILGWQFVNNTKYIVLRNPWGYQEGTLNVNSGPWTSFDQFDGGDVVGTLALPENGVFSLAADTFQQYYGWYGWVS